MTPPLARASPEQMGSEEVRGNHGVLALDKRYRGYVLTRP